LIFNKTTPPGGGVYTVLLGGQMVAVGCTTKNILLYKILNVNYYLPMATIAQVKQLRLDINDPQGFVDIIEIEDLDDLPAAPAPQTVYHLEGTSKYYSTEKTSGAAASDYSVAELYLSDTTIESLIDELGIAKAECRAFGLIARKIGAQLQIKRNQTGAESTEYVSLAELYRYYKDLSDACKEENASDAGTNTGKYGASTAPEIAGGNL
jgi:hypothetical protein